MTYTLAAFYRFVSLPDPSALQQRLSASFHETELCGTLILAGEGVNGTLAGSSEVVNRLLDTLQQELGLERSEVKFATADERPFGRLKFQLKREIIPFRKADVDLSRTGEYVHPEQWNVLIADPEVFLLDTRNQYEVELGTFTGAVNPGIETFSDLASYVREHMDPLKQQKVAMFCTGGIRCEKASAFMRQEGFQEVYQLKGGILKYLEEIPEEASTWQGECFVFDRRTAVDHADFEDPAASSSAS